MTIQNKSGRERKNGTSGCYIIKINSISIVYPSPIDTQSHLTLTLTLTFNLNLTYFFSIVLNLFYMEKLLMFSDLENGFFPICDKKLSSKLLNGFSRLYFDQS
ncbi:hypothetical protein CCP3SC1AL1_3360004 [Gammaproteobacteria bacterium]